jgi:transposase
MAFIRRIKKKSGTYLALVESYRENGKNKQRVKQYIGREIDGKPVRRVKTSSIGIQSVKRYGDVMCIGKLSDTLGLNDMFGEYSKEILLMTFSHLLDNVSMYKIREWSEHTEIPDMLGMKSVSTKNLYNALAYLNSIDFDAIEENIHRKLSEYDNGKKTVVIDVTDTYFEGRKGSQSRRRRGKDGKVRHLLQLCLAVTLRHGFPVAHRVYGGNISNIKMFTEMSALLKERGFNSIIVDRGMHSEDNVKNMESLRMKVIMGVAKKRGIASRFLTGITRERIYRKRNRIVLKNTSVYAMRFPFMKGKLIIIYNPALDAIKREHHYERGGSDNEAAFLGYSLIYHNTGLKMKTVVKRYFEKDVIERSFKQMKGVISLRPVRFWLKNHVNAHMHICYLSYALLSLMAYKIRDMEISAPDALEKLKTAYQIHMKDKDSDFEWSSMVTLEKVQESILKKVGVVYKS